ncbi:protein of unknown function [Cupriavidus taiwanensis]|nr:protein of unknown function [Cupriavidus taiwanensis]
MPFPPTHRARENSFADRLRIRFTQLTVIRIRATSVSDISRASKKSSYCLSKKIQFCFAQDRS